MEKKTASDMPKDGKSPPPVRRRRKVPRLYVVYIILAVFNVMAVSLSLVLHNRMASIYTTTAEENQRWAARHQLLEVLRLRITALNTPGNNVFQSGDPVGERNRQNQMIQAFERRLQETRQEFAANLPESAAPRFLAHLDNVESLAAVMVAESDRLFDSFRRGDLAEAGARMAGMDRQFVRLIDAVSRLEQESNKYQGRVLEQQSAATRRTRYIQFTIATLIILMVVGAVIYGHHLWRQTAHQDQERLEQIAALEASEHRFRELAEGSIEGIVVHKDGRPLFVNKAWAEMHGIADPDEILGTENLSSFISPQDRKAVQDIQYALQVGVGAYRRYEYRGLRRDGQQPWLECLEHVVSWQGEPVLQSTVIDITERKKAENDLRTAMMQAEQATNARTRFFAAASHDLRQPLHAISLYLPLVSRQVESKKGQEMLNSIQRSAEAMRSLLDSLLDISRLDAGVIEPEIGPVSLLEIFDQLGMEFMPQARAKSLEFRIVAADYWVQSDPALLERILRNLLTNAIRYTVQGKILLGARRDGDSIRMEVWDTGIGIPPEIQEHIFEEFYQADNPERDRARGLGLGLAIIDRLTRLLDHKLTVRSQTRKGSVFSVTAPRCAEPETHAASQPARSEEARDFAGRVALLVDDDTAVLEGAEAMFQEWGFEVICAESIGEAMSKTKSATRNPDVILADLRLRGNETGLQAVQEIRQAFGERIPGIIVTGDTDPERIRQASATDCTLMHKPVEPGKLKGVLSRLLEEGPNTPPDTAYRQTQTAG